MMETPDGPRPGNIPPSYNPNALANNLQNLQMGPPNQQRPSNSIDSPPRPISTPPFAGSRPVPPPPGVFPMSPVPANAQSQNGFPPGFVSTGPNGTPPASQPPSHFASRPPPPGVLSGPGPRVGPFPSSPLSPGPPTQTQMRTPGPVSNGLSAPPLEMIQNGPRFPPVTGGMTRPPVLPQQAPTAFSSVPSSQLPLPSFGTPSHSVPPMRPPFSASPQNMPPPMPLTAPVRGMLRSQSPPYGHTWPPQPQQMPPLLPPDDPTLQQPMFRMPPPPLRNQPVALNQMGQSRMDTDQIPRIEPSSAVILHETRQANQANPPPPATSDYIVMDTGNCSPRYLRCTLNQIPCTADLLLASAMELALLVQPLALPHPSEEPIQVVDFGESGPVRCSRCKGYVNPFMKFIDYGKRFICNFCGFTDETPQDYFCNLGPDGRRRDADERPELCRGTVEFVASREFMLRDPVQPVFFFVIDVSLNAIQTGATAAACSAINQVIADLPEGPRTMVGVATFDSTIHFYNLKCTQEQPSMLVVPDIQDVYTPLQSDVIVQLTECHRQLEILLESIPTMFQNNKVADSAFGAAVKAAFLAMRSTGGKLLVFQSVLPLIGIGSLSAREAVGKSNVSAGEKEAQKLLQPADKILKALATEFAEHQVCVDLFITTQSYVDIASLSVIPRTTGGQMYYYYPFSALCDSAKLYNDLRWNVTRPQGFEAVMRVRCSQGIDVLDYSGNFCKHVPAEVDLPAIDCDKTIMVSVKYDDKLQEGLECTFQCALIYTNVYGQRRIRVSTLSLPCTNMLSNLFRSADLETQFACTLKQVASEIPSVPVAQVRDKAKSICTSILIAYRKSSATVSSGQFILPEALKLLPLYTLALTKSSGLRTDARIDERSFWISRVSALSTPLLIPLVYPRLIAVHDLDEKELDDSVIPNPISLSSEHVTDEGIYLLENGEDCLIYVGGSVQPNILQQLFSFSSVQEMSDKLFFTCLFILEQYDNTLSKKLNAIVNEIRRQRCSFLRLKLCRKGDPSGATFFSYMVEDKTQNELSYVEYLMHIHRHIQSKMV